MRTWFSPPLLDASEMRATDEWAISEQGVSSLELMERAGQCLADRAASRAGSGPVRVVCGKGNNGGDGLVAARLLGEQGHAVEVVLPWPADQLSGDAAANLRRLRERSPGTPIVEQPADPAAALEGSGCVVDAIFGTGFAGAPREPARATIEAINGCGAPVVAADVASGVDASTGEVAGAAVGASDTVAFHAAKIGHLVAPGKGRTGELEIGAIGIPDGAPVEPGAGCVGSGVLGLAPRRGPASTKFSSGQVLVVGGSRGLTGAVCMAAEAAIRAGAGYATAAVPEGLEPIFEAKLTEVMTAPMPEGGGFLAAEAVEPVLEASARAGAVLLGPGLGRAAPAFGLARELARRIEPPLVIDADGLNALAGRLGELRKRTGPAVLTPHAGELGRLLDRPSREVSASRLACARRAAELAGAIVVLKGDDTLVADPGGELAVNRLGAPGLATAGTGDVLSGAIAALLARGMEPFAAACAAVLAHARAGRRAAQRVGAAESVIATDVIAGLPEGLVAESER